jgi:hypothetical protein
VAVLVVVVIAAAA